MSKSLILRGVQIQIKLSCHHCQGTRINKNGIKSYGKQNYICRDCKKQFVSGHNLTYKGCHSQAEQTIKIMTVRVAASAPSAPLPVTAEVICLRTRKRGNRRLRMGQTGFGNGVGIKKQTVRIGHYLLQDCYGQLEEFPFGFFGLQAYRRQEIYAGNRREQLPFET